MRWYLSRNFWDNWPLWWPGILFLLIVLVLLVMTR